MKTNILKTMAVALVGLSLAACSDVDIQSTPYSEKVTDLAYTADGRDVTLTWQLPQAEGLSGVRIDKDGTLAAELDGAVTSWLAKHVAVNTDIYYTVKACYDNGLTSEGQTVKVRIDSDAKAKAGFLLPQADESTLDDDEKAALDWFRANYPDGVVLTPADMADVYPDEISEIWVQVDRVGMPQGWRNLPSELVADDVIAALANYVKNGGNLLLTKHATQLVAAIGRVSENRAPNLYSDGAGGEGTDIWTAQAIVGYDMTERYDHTDHAIYKGLVTVPESQTGFGGDTYALEGPGMREDHNCMWDCNNTSLEISNEPNVIKGFETATNSTVLATWAHVRDYCCAGIVDFNPDGDYLGRVLCIGLNAYEWNQNDRTNEYQSNIELLTKNCLDYLKQ